MKRVVVLGTLGLASVACGLFTVPEATPRVTGDSNPLAEGLTAYVTQAGESTPPSPTLADEPAATSTPVPTPVTTFSSTANRQIFGNVSVLTISNITRYALLGQTALEIDQYMRQFGPPDSAGTRWFALTDALFNWNDTCICDGGGCVTGPVEVTVTVEYTWPTWEPSSGADPVLEGQWNFFEDALTTHEQGHGDRHSICGQWLGEAFLTLSPQPSCEALDNAMSGASGPVFAECRAAQGAYEAQTNHGQNDGVLWPP